MTDAEVLEGDMLKAGDTEPALIVRLIEEDTAWDLTGFTATLRVRNTQTQEVVVNTQPTIKNAREGIVEYSWQSGDTTDAGLYEAEVSATDGTDTITFPNDGYFTVTVRDTLS